MAGGFFKDIKKVASKEKNIISSTFSKEYGKAKKVFEPPKSPKLPSAKSVIKSVIKANKKRKARKDRNIKKEGDKDV